MWVYVVLEGCVCMYILLYADINQRSTIEDEDEQRGYICHSLIVLISFSGTDAMPLFVRVNSLENEVFECISA